MATDEHKRLVQCTFEELFNQGRLALADELVSADFINHDAPPDAPGGPTGLRYIVTMLRTGFPDLHFDIHEMIAEGDLVAVRTTLRGTHNGPFMGIPPTGRPIVQEQMHFVRFADGKAVEHRAVRDDLGAWQQLGVIPPPHQAVA